LPLGKVSLKIVLASLVATIYAVITVSLGSLGYSWIQIRISEALTPLPYLLGFPAVIGLTLGCCIANWFSPVGLPDLIFGPFLTLIGALLSWKLNFKKKIIACTYPILVNAFGASSYISVYYNVPYWVNVATVGAGEIIAVVVVGYPLLVAIERALINQSARQI
jgi:uncharacterized membrane protein